jgi:hypothetical protein
MAHAWTALYKDALRCEDVELVRATLLAIIAMHVRLHEIGFPPKPGDLRERTALFVAISDLRVLRTTFQRNNALDRPVNN